MKYILIKKYDNIDENIIDLNNSFKDTKFYFDYCFPFFGTIITKIIYLSVNIFSINYENLSGSALGSFIEEKIKKFIIFDKFLKEKVNLRYVWNLENCNNNIKKKSDKINYENFEKIEYDENISNIILDSSFYYIIPGSQINKSLDSAILMKEINNKFRLITFQITNNKENKIKEKENYIKYSFTAKEKFEKIYNINITNVYFYFILSEEFTSEKTITTLNEKKIPFLFFSFKKGELKKDEKCISSITNLCDVKAEIEKENDKENDCLIEKNYHIFKLECFLQKKRREGIIITMNMFENGRKTIFTKDKGFKLKKIERNQIINHLKKYYLINENFTIKYVFKIKLSEVFELSKNEDLFGILLHQNEIYIHYKNNTICLNDKKIIFDYELNEKIINLENNIKKERKSISMKSNLNLSNIKNEDEIYIFKIYKLINI